MVTQTYVSLISKNNFFCVRGEMITIEVTLKHHELVT